MPRNRTTSLLTLGILAAIAVTLLVLSSWSNEAGKLPPGVSNGEVGSEVPAQPGQPIPAVPQASAPRQPESNVLVAGESEAEAMRPQEPPFVESARADLPARRAAIDQRRIGDSLEAKFPSPVFQSGTRPSASWSSPASSASPFSISPWAMDYASLDRERETTEVFGSVYAIERGTLRPLAGAVVADLYGQRVVTELDGSFVLRAACEGTRVWLHVAAPGFVSAFEVSSLVEHTGTYSGKWFEVATCKARPGAELFVVEAPTERVTLRIAAPAPPPPGIRLWAGWLGVGGPSEHFDTDFIFSALADENGEVTFDVPLRVVGAHFGAHGPGFVADASCWKESAREPDGRRVIECHLTAAPTHLLRGRVTDLRNGSVVAGARVATHGGAAVLTDRNGNFEIWAAAKLSGSNWRDPEVLQVCAWGYFGMETRLDQPEIVAATAGGCTRPSGIEEPALWDFQLRPTVRVVFTAAQGKGKSVARACLSVPSPNVWQGESTNQSHMFRPSNRQFSIGPNGQVEVLRFPWGVPLVEYSALVDERWVLHELAMTPAMWAGGGPEEWEFAFEIP